MTIGRAFRILFGIEIRLENLRIRQRALEQYLAGSLCLAQDGESLPSEPMVVPRLSGGLGNQMFQIAAAYALARRTGSKLALNYEGHLVTGQGNPPSKYKDTIFNKIATTDYWPAPIYRYYEHIYFPIMPKRHLLLDGYFQSKKYFADYSDEVKVLLQLPENVREEARHFLGKDPRPAVGIHVRLGDYLSDRHRASLNVCPPEYYRRAIRSFSGKNYRFILCSDDPKKAKTILRGVDLEVFRGSDDVTEMALLSQCPNLIISNSSFSWWSAFLGIKKDRVLAPKVWFVKNSGLIGDDIYEAEWQRVSTSKSFSFI